VKFLKTPIKKGSSNTMMSSIPMTGASLTKILRGVYSRTPKTALTEAKKELVDNQGFADFKTKKGEKELLDVMRGTKMFVGETDHPDGLETVLDPSNPNP
jgi:hypothetical protein